MTPKNDELMPEDIKQAREILADWCSNNGRKFLMSIPVQGRDHDMIMARVIRAAEKTLAIPTAHVSDVGDRGWSLREPLDGTQVEYLSPSGVFEAPSWSPVSVSKSESLQLYKAGAGFANVKFTATHWRPIKKNIPAPPRSGGGK